MSQKRFTTNGYVIYDTFHDGVNWLVNEVEAEEIIEVMNNLDTKARERSKALSKLQKENEQLKSEIKGMQELLKSYRKTIKYDAELLADATKNGYLPPLGEWKEVEE